MERLLKKEQIQGVRKEDFQLISSYTNDIEHAESIITHCEDCIKKSNELIKEYQDETCIAINKSEVKPLLLKYLPILQWKFNYSHPTFPIDRLYLFSIKFYQFIMSILIIINFILLFFFFLFLL